MSRWVKAATVLLAVAVLGVALAFFSGAFHPKVDAVVVPEARLGDQVFTVVAISVPVVVPIPGTVRATDETIIGSRLLAAVTRVHVRSGGQAKQGDVLLELDDSGPRAILQQRQQTLASARAALDEAAANRTRAVDLFEGRNLSRADYDRALTNQRIAEAEVLRADQAVAEASTLLGFTRVTAPMSGTVVERYVEPGDTAVPGQPLLKLFNPGGLRVEALLRESLIGHVEAGQVLPTHIDALDLNFESIVEEIVPSADPGSRTFTIKALLPPSAKLYPGMFARLEILVGSQQRMVVPSGSVHRAGQLRFVYVRTEAGDVRRLVRLGDSTDDGVVVLSGLEAGQAVVLPAA